MRREFLLQIAFTFLALWLDLEFGPTRAPGSVEARYTP